MNKGNAKCSLVVTNGEQTLFGMAAVLKLIKIRGGWDTCIKKNYIKPDIMVMNREFYYNYAYKQKVKSVY